MINRLFLCSSLLLADIASANASAKSVDVVGDVNGDGVLTITDAVGIIDYIIGEHTLSFPLDAGDVNGDGKITITDAVYIVSLILGDNPDVSVDTITIKYLEDKVLVDGNFDKNILKVSVKGTKVKVTSSGKRPFVCLAEGESSDGTLVIDADTTCTLTLNNLQLSSQESAAISFTKKQKVNIELPKGSHSILSDASSRTKGDEAKACLYSKGTMTFTGKGSLSVSGNYSHAIASSKNISVEGGHLAIENVVKNGIHCDKFTLKKGQIDLHLQNNASKGIKAKEELNIKGGSIEGEASGGITIEDGDLSYCALLKSDSCMKVSDGTITLTHTGDGGRCISVDRNLTITGGTFTLECDGDGREYTNTDNKVDYYTPKCITTNGNMNIERGTLHILATGNGGKGVDCSDSLFIGRMTDYFISPDSLLIDVETRGTALVDDFEEDYRRGCPKAIKADNDIHIYSGTLHLRTHGQGGEGIECKHSLRTYYSTIMADCYDDGINTGERCQINGSQIFCRSINNDGIDSNGKLTINDGIVAAISEHFLNESFDTESGCLYIYGGQVIGIGNNEVYVSELSSIPYYATKLTIDDIGRRYGEGFAISSGNYLTVKKGEESLLSLYHECTNNDTFIIVASPQLEKGQIFQISDGEKPLNASSELFDGRVLMGGLSKQNEHIINFIPK